VTTETTETTETEVEGIKRSSHLLRGSLAEELLDGALNISNEGEHLLKFHGVYSQDDRDLRRELTLAKEPLAYSFMIRVPTPGGRLTSEQWLALDRVADELANGTLRLTTREAVQFHGVAKIGLRPLSKLLNEHLLTSFGGCGDVVRNIVTCPRLQINDPEGPLSQITRHLAANLKPTSRAHWEIFVEGERAASSEPIEEHEFYGETYLPRKFKIAIAHPGDNCVDVYAQDVGLVPVRHPERGEGFTVLVGGGLGRSYAKEDTFARLADPLAFVTYDEVEDLIKAIIASYRDLGDRTDRRRARLKYVLADAGLESFTTEVENRYGRTLTPPVPVLPDIDADDHLGWRASDDGSWALGVRIGAGRVADFKNGLQLRTALAEVARRFCPVLYVTAQQDLIISGMKESDRPAIDALLEEHNVRSAGELGSVERTALACVALPTCSQALTEAERQLPEMVAALESSLESVGIGQRPLQLRMTGCPNGCARPAVAEVGLVGRTKTSYDLIVGGGLSGNRLARTLAEKVKIADVPSVLEPLFIRWRDEGNDSESFGDFVTRIGL